MDLKTAFTQSNGLLDAFAQPALVLRGRELAHCNRAAADRLPEAALLLPPLLEALAEGRTELTLEDRRWTLTAADLGEDERLVTFAPAEAWLSPEILGVIARSLRQPLASLFSASHKLFPLLENLQDPELQEQTAQMNRAFYQLLRTANNLTDAGSYLTQDARLNLRRVELRAFLEELAHSLDGMLKDVGLTLEARGPSSLTFTYLDAEKVRRAVLYLMSNAVKYSPPGGVIRLDLEADVGAVTFRCTDQGEGLDPAVMGHLSDLASLQGGVGDSRWGLGLGLQMVWAVARLHGGTLLAQQPAGGGTQFILSLMRIQHPEPVLLREPLYDLAGGYNPCLIELAEVLPSRLYDSRDTI